MLQFSNSPTCPKHGRSVSFTPSPKKQKAHPLADDENPGDIFNPPCNECHERNILCEVQPVSRRVRACASCKRKKIQCSFVSRERPRDRSVSVALRPSRSKSRPAGTPSLSNRKSAAAKKSPASEASSKAGPARRARLASVRKNVQTAPSVETDFRKCFNVSRLLCLANFLQ